MSVRRLAGSVLGVALALILAGTALADSCANVSRAAPACDMSCTSPVVDGNWVWLPSLGIPEPAWGFSPPGSITSQEFGLPDANGNYAQSQGGASWLLEKSAICVKGVPSRQMAHGIQSGCGS